MTELTDTLRRTFEAIASRPIPHDWTESAPPLAEYRNLAGGRDPEPNTRPSGFEDFDSNSAVNDEGLSNLS